MAVEVLPGPMAEPRAQSGGADAPGGTGPDGTGPDGTGAAAPEGRGAATLDPTGAGPALTVGFRHVGAVCVLTLRGALTADTLRLFECQIDRLGRTACHRVVLDVTALGVVDQAAARVLTGLHHYVEARGGRLTVAGATGGVARILATTPLVAG